MVTLFWVELGSAGYVLGSGGIILDGGGWSWVYFGW